MDPKIISDEAVEEPSKDAGLITQILGALFRSFRLDKIIAASVILGLLITFLRFLDHQNHKNFEQLGNTIIISGALLVSKGVVIKNDVRNWLFKIIEQERVSPTIFLRETNLLRFQLRVMKRDKKNIPAKSIRSMYRKRARRLTTPGGIRRTLGQKMLAEMFISASDYGEAGTLLVVVGTLCVMLNNFAS